MLTLYSIPNEAAVNSPAKCAAFLAIHALRLSLMEKIKGFLSYDILSALLAGKDVIVPAQIFRARLD